MKGKTAGRIGGAIGVTLAGILGAGIYYTMSKSEPGMGELIASSISSPLVLYLFVDSVTDMFIGTHHYVTANLWKRLSRDENTRIEIDEYLQRVESLKEEEFETYSQK